VLFQLVYTEYSIEYYKSITFFLCCYEILANCRKFITKYRKFITKCSKFTTKIASSNIINDRKSAFCKHYSTLVFDIVTERFHQVYCGYARYFVFVYAGFDSINLEVERLTNFTCSKFVKEIHRIRHLILC